MQNTANGTLFNDVAEGKIIFFTWDAEDNWNVLHVSSSVSQVLGYKVDDFISGKTVYVDLIHPDDLERVQQEVRQALQQKIREFTHQTYRIRDAQGHYRAIYDHTKIVWDKYGKAKEFQGYIFDESEIVEQQQRLELVIKGTNLGMWDWYPQTNEVMFDENWAKMLGYELNEITPSLSEWETRVHPDDLASCYADIQAHIAGQIDYYENIHRMQHKNGNWLYILDRGKIVERDNQGQPLRFTGTHTNITELKTIQENLEKSQQEASAKTQKLKDISQRYRNLLHYSADAVFILSTSGHLLDYSELTQKALGYSDKEMQTLTVFDWDKSITPADYLNLMQVLETEDIQIERVHTRKDGSTYDALINAKKIKVDNKQTIYAVTRDITEQNRLKKALAKEKRYNDLIVESANTIITVIKLDGTMVQLNRYGEEFVGLSQQEVSAKPFFWSRFLIEEDREKVFAIVQKAVQGEITESFRNYWVHHSGEARMIEWSNSLMMNEDGTIDGIFCIGIDIHKEFHLNAKLHRAHKSLEEAQEIAQLGFWEYDALKDELIWSDKTYDIFEVEDRDTHLSLDFFASFVHPIDTEKVMQAFEKSIKDHSDYQITHQIITAKGKELYLAERCQHQFNKQGDLIRSFGTVQNVSDLVLTNQKLQLANNIIENAMNGIVITDANNIILDVNQAFCQISGYEKNELINQYTNINKSGMHDAEFYKELYEHLTEHHHWHGKISNRRKDGSIYTCLLNISGILDDYGKILFYAAIYSDISDIQKSQEKLDYIAHHDALTHLPNRARFNEELEHAIARAQRNDNQLALLFFDVDRFKQINDTFGHVHGDALLQEVSRRIVKFSRKSDLFARLGGDEFVILIEDLESVESSGFVAQKVLQAFNQPFELDNDIHVTVTSSIGIATYPQDATDSIGLLSNADSAMYSSKSLGGAQYQFYTPSLTENVKQKLFIESSLRKAVEMNEFTLVYQPQVNLEKGCISGVEALLRWQHSTIGNIPPDQFIPVAEETGIIQSIGTWVLETAFAQARKWANESLEFGTLAINISVLQLQQENFPELLQGLINKHQVAANLIEIEVTESIFIKNLEHALKQLSQIRAMGFSIAIDDFGTGFSSLSNLKKLPIQKLKIDKSFVSDIPQDLDDIAITKTIISMGLNLGLTLIAEGVETEAQLKFLEQQNCHECQGYLYSKPLPETECTNFIQNFKF